MKEVLDKVKEKIVYIWKNDRTLFVKTVIVLLIFIIALFSLITGERAEEKDGNDEKDVFIVSETDKDKNNENDRSSKDKDKESKIIYVDVEGAVVSPGVVKTPPDSRVFYAVDMAGGLTSEADTSKINLAEKLSDGDKIYVPFIKEDDDTGSDGRYSDMEINGGINDSSTLNINTASRAELESVPGIGPSTAQNIIDYRNENGGFRKLTDLLEISGIGEKTFAKFKDKLCV